MDKGTVVRTVAMVLVWVNVWLEQLGLNAIPIISEEVIALILTTIVSIWTWFKNNYITWRGKRQKEVLEQNNLTK